MTSKKLNNGELYITNGRTGKKVKFATVKNGNLALEVDKEKITNFLEESYIPKSLIDENKNPERDFWQRDEEKYNTYYDITIVKKKNWFIRLFGWLWGAN